MLAVFWEKSTHGHSHTQVVKHKLTTTNVTAVVSPVIRSSVMFFVSVFVLLYEKGRTLGAKVRHVDAARTVAFFVFIWLLRLEAAAPHLLGGFTTYGVVSSLLHGLLSLSRSQNMLFFICLLKYCFMSVDICINCQCGFRS